jgi:hypothetical protein
MDWNISRALQKSSILLSLRARCGAVHAKAAPALYERPISDLTACRMAQAWPKSLESGSQGEAQVMKSARGAGLMSLRWSVQSGLSAKLRLSHRMEMDQGKTRTGIGRLFTELHARTNVRRKRSILSIAARPSGIREQDDLTCSGCAFDLGRCVCGVAQTHRAQFPKLRKTGFPWRNL